MFETQKSGKKTSSGMNGLKIKNSEHVAGLFYFIPLWRHKHAKLTVFFVTS